MIRVGSVRRSTATEVPSDDLEEIAFLFAAPISLPGGCAGWARVSLPDGRRFRSWVAAPGEQVAS